MFTRFAAVFAAILGFVQPASAATPTLVSLGVDRTISATPTLCITSGATCLATIGKYVEAGGGAFAFIGTGTQINVQATNGNVLRSLGARAADRANVLDQLGVDRTGATDSQGGFAATSTMAATNGTSVYIPDGSYKLNSLFTPATNQTVELGSTVFTGAGNIAGAGDWSPYLAPIEHGWITTTNLPGTQFGLNASLTAASSGATSGYEKGAAYFQATTSDPSKYASLGDAADVWKDVVGLQGSGNIATGNMRGRAFGAAFYGTVQSGSDGGVAGFEADVTNNGADQADSEAWNSKNVANLFTYGTAPVTNGLIIGRGSVAATMHRGIEILGESVTEYAIRMTNPTNHNAALAGIDYLGGVFGTSLKSSGGITLSTPVTLSTSSTTQGVVVDGVDNAVITSCGSGAGITLNAQVGEPQRIANRSNVCLIWPPAGARIEAIGTNGADSLAANANATFVCINTAQCYRFQ